MPPAGSAVHRFNQGDWRLCWQSCVTDRRSVDDEMVKEKGQVVRRVDLIDRQVVGEEHLMCIGSDLS